MTSDRNRKQKEKKATLSGRINIKKQSRRKKKRRKENRAALFLSIVEWKRTRASNLMYKKEKKGIVDSYSTYTRSNTFTTGRTSVRVHRYNDRQQRENKK